MGTLFGFAKQRKRNTIDISTTNNNVFSGIDNSKYIDSTERKKYNKKKKQTTIILSSAAKRGLFNRKKFGRA